MPRRSPNVRSPFLATQGDLAPEPTIRAYEPRDRGAVRRISYDTADGGASGAAISGDRELIEDVLTEYYTGYEPGSLSVMEVDGNVVGYLEGCLDTRRQLSIMIKHIWPRAIVKAIMRGALFHADIWRLAWSAMKVFLSGGAERGVDLGRYPAHLHVDILEGYRGRKAGAALMERFLAQASAAGAAGVHLAVREDNAPARRFFEKAGFMEITKQPSVFVPRGMRRLYSVIYGKVL